LEVSRIFLEEAGVAVTPGVEFGNSVKSFIRFSYANSLQNIQKGFNRLISLLGS
jgi:aspartate aminotransferase